MRAGAACHMVALPRGGAAKCEPVSYRKGGLVGKGDWKST